MIEDGDIATDYDMDYLFDDIAELDTYCYEVQFCNGYDVYKIMNDDVYYDPDECSIDWIEDKGTLLFRKDGQYLGLILGEYDGSSRYVINP